MDDNLTKLRSFVKELGDICHAAHSSSNAKLGWEKHERWKHRLVKFIKEIFGQNEADKAADLSYPLVMGYDPFENLDSCINAYNTYLQVLIDDVEQNPSSYSDAIPEVAKAVGLDLWELIHPSIKNIAKPRFESGLYADAIEASLKEINDKVKVLHKQRCGTELDGADLMYQAFSPKAPSITLDDLSSENGRNIQQGYMQIFAGSMIGIRNPKAHSNVVIDEKRAIHLLFLCSLLMEKIDERIK